MHIYKIEYNVKDRKIFCIFYVSALLSIYSTPSFKIHPTAMVYKFFDKKSERNGAKQVNTKLTPQNQQLAEELHKPIIRKFEKRKVHAAFKDNIWGADLADMQLLSKYNKRNRFLICVIDIFSKYTWVVPLKDKKSVSIVTAFQSILKQ